MLAVIAIATARRAKAFAATTFRSTEYQKITDRHHRLKRDVDRLSAASVQDNHGMARVALEAFSDDASEILGLLSGDDESGKITQVRMDQINQYRETLHTSLVLAEKAMRRMAASNAPVATSTRLAQSAMREALNMGSQCLAHASERITLGWVS